MPTAPTENTALLDEFNEVRREFDHDIREYEPDSGETFYSLLFKRPAATLFLLALFALVLLLSQSVPQIARELPDVPIALVEAIDLVAIRTHEIEANVTLSIFLNYSKLGDSIAAKLLVLGAGLLGTVSLQFPETTELLDEQLRHLADVQLSPLDEVSLMPDSHQDIETTLLIQNLGSSDALGSVVKKFLTSEPATFVLRGQPVIAKWGLTFGINLDIRKEVTLPQYQENIDACLKSIDLDQSQSGQIDVDAKMNATVSIPLTGDIPMINWTFKLSGCSGLVVVGEGSSDVVNVRKESDETDLSIQSTIGKLAEELKTECGDGLKSPLDNWISRYLNGESSVVYIAGRPEDDGIVSRFLESLNDIPLPVMGKPSTEKLIDSIELKNVLFQGVTMRDPKHGRFTGEVLASLVLPSIIQIQQERLILAATEVRGEINLFSRGQKFGVITASRWIPTITVGTDTGYNVRCFLDRVPFEVVNSGEFGYVSQHLLIEGHVEVQYDAILDFELATPVGSFELKEIYLDGHTTLKS